MRLHAVALAAAVLLAACSPSPTDASGDAAALRLDRIPSGSQAADQVTLDSARAAIKRLAGAGQCADGTCASLGIGAKPCGGPWEYVAYCPTGGDAARLRALAAEYTSATRAFNNRYGVGSTCDMAPPVPGCPIAD